MPAWLDTRVDGGLLVLREHAGLYVHAERVELPGGRRRDRRLSE